MTVDTLAQIQALNGRMDHLLHLSNSATTTEDLHRLRVLVYEAIGDCDLILEQQYIEPIMIGKALLHMTLAKMC